MKRYVLNQQRNYEASSLSAESGVGALTSSSSDNKEGAKNDGCRLGLPTVGRRSQEGRPCLQDLSSSRNQLLDSADIKSSGPTQILPTMDLQTVDISSPSHRAAAAAPAKEVFRPPEQMKQHAVIHDNEEDKQSDINASKNRKDSEVSAADSRYHFSFYPLLKRQGRKSESVLHDTYLKNNRNGEVGITRRNSVASHSNTVHTVSLSCSSIPPTDAVMESSNDTATVSSSAVHAPGQRLSFQPVAAQQQRLTNISHSDDLSSSSSPETIKQLNQQLNHLDLIHATAERIRHQNKATQQFQEQQRAAISQRLATAMAGYHEERIRGQLINDMLSSSAAAAAANVATTNNHLGRLNSFSSSYYSSPPVAATASGMLFDNERKRKMDSKIEERLILESLRMKRQRTFMSPASSLSFHPSSLDPSSSLMSSLNMNQNHQSTYYDIYKNNLRLEAELNNYKSLQSALLNNNTDSMVSSSSSSSNFALNMKNRADIPSSLSNGPPSIRSALPLYKHGDLCQEIPKRQVKPHDSLPMKKRSCSNDSSATAGKAGGTVGTPPRKEHFSKRPYMHLGTDSDEIWLSKFLSFLREECIEVFEATQVDVMERKTSKKIQTSQVGLRCRFCAHVPYRARVVRSSCFPSSISRIYQSLTMMIREHFSRCPEMPSETRSKYTGLKFMTKKGEIESKTHWIESAQSIGMIDTEKGIFLNKPLQLTFPDNNLPSERADDIDEEIKTENEASS